MVHFGQKILLSQNLGNVILWTSLGQLEQIFTKHQIFIFIFNFLSKNHDYDVYVHDKNYFAINANNNGIPNLYLAVSTKPYYYQINLVEHHDLNLPSSPCNEDLKYNFQVRALINIPVYNM